MKDRLVHLVRRDECVDWLLLLVPGAIWGASFLFIAEGMRSIGPNGVTFSRILVGFSTLSFLPAARRPVPSSDWPRIAWLGLLWLAFPLSMFPYAELHVSSALTGMLNAANPLFMVFVAAAIARQVPRRGVLAGMAIGIAGTILMAVPSIGKGHSSTVGILMILAALVSYGIALNIAVPLQRRNGALPVLWRAQMVALILVAPMGLSDVIAARWTPGPVIALLLLGVLGTGVAHVVLSIAAGKLGATRASATTFVIPAVALVLGVVVRNESVAPLSVLGSVVCIGGAWAMRRTSTSMSEEADATSEFGGDVRDNPKAVLES